MPCVPCTTAQSAANHPRLHHLREPLQPDTPCPSMHAFSRKTLRHCAFADGCRTLKRDIRGARRARAHTHLFPSQRCGV
eukprot:2941694-Pleurochrysis_carterae.AAC.1